MSITASIRKRPWLLLGMIFIALLAFLVNPDSMDQMFGKNPNILGKVNGEEITTITRATTARLRRTGLANFGAV